MTNVRKAIAGIVVAGALAWPASSAATATGGSPTRGAIPAANVETANANVDGELAELADVRPGATVEVVPVGPRLHGLLQDPGFLANVHRLQAFLNDHDAGALSGADVPIRDLVAVDVRPDGGITVFAR